MDRAMEDKPVDHLKGARKSFHIVVDFALRVSLALNGKPATNQSELASVVQAKMAVNGASIEHVLGAPIFDHSVVISLCRMIMESSVFFQYLRETVDQDEWQCRLLCMRLHDATNRIKLLRGFQKPDEHADLRAGREDLLKQLEENAHYKSLPAERAERLLSGEHFYLRGVNTAVGVSAKWNAKKYMALYSYFSAHAHSAPMSFFRFKEQRMRFGDPSEAQRNTMVTALSVAEYSLLKVSLAYLRASPDSIASFEAKELADMDSDLNSWRAQFETDRGVDVSVL